MNWVWKQTSKQFKPPQKLKVSEWADQYRVLTSDSSAESGKWRTSRAEYQRGIMDAVVEREVERVVIMSSSQVGKTEIINNILGYYISQDPSPILIIQPTLEMSRTWSKDRLNPMITSAPVLKTKVREARTKDSENTILHKRFDGGHLSIVGANSASGLASRPIRILLCDEIDRYPFSAGVEGDSIQLATARTKTFWNRKIVMCSTPTIDGESRIQSAFQTSDKRYYYVPCPECNHYQTLKWANVAWDKDKPETAYYICEECACVIQEKSKLKMIRDGEWRSTETFNRTAGFYVNELYSVWSTWAEMAINFLECKKHPEMLKAFINTSLGEVFKIESQEIPSESLMARRENFDFNSVPDEVLLITAGVDVQQDRIETQVIGWSLEGTYVLDYKIHYGDTSTKQVWNDLDVYLTTRFKRESKKALPISCTTIDSGYNTQSVYNFVKNKVGRRIFAVKGVSTAGKPIASRPSISGTQRIKLFSAGVDTAKETIFNWLQIDEPAVGYIHFASHLDEEYFKQLTAEQRSVKFVKGKKQVVWIQKRKRNESLDTFVYNLVAYHILQPNMEKLAEVKEPTQNKPKKPINALHQMRKPRPRKNFVNSWR